jgi:hypothetical protein
LLAKLLLPSDSLRALWLETPTGTEVALAVFLAIIAAIGVAIVASFRVTRAIGRRILAFLPAVVRRLAQPLREQYATVDDLGVLFDATSSFASRDLAASLFADLTRSEAASLPGRFESHGKVVVDVDRAFAGIRSQLWRETALRVAQLCHDCDIDCILVLQPVGAKQMWGRLAASLAEKFSGADGIAVLPLTPASINAGAINNPLLPRVAGATVLIVQPKSPPGAEDKFMDAACQFLIGPMGCNIGGVLRVFGNGKQPPPTGVDPVRCVTLIILEDLT